MNKPVVSIFVPAYNNPVYSKKTLQSIVEQNYRPIELLFLDDCSPTPLEPMVEEFRKRRDLIYEKLNSLPNITCVKPKGAFYVFPNITKTGLTSEEFSKLMLEEAGVATCPGNYFGAEGEGYVRFCYANSIENINKGIERIREVLIKKTRV